MNDFGNWRERLDKVKQLGDALKAKPYDLELTDKISAYTQDPKWEVRKVVAQAIPFISPELHFRFAVLKDDVSSGVKCIADRNLVRKGVSIASSRTVDAEELAAYHKMQKIKLKAEPRLVDEIKFIYREQYDQSIASLGHEIRGMLATIKNNQERLLEMLKETLTEDKQQSAVRAVQLIGNSCRRLELLADDIRQLVFHSTEEMRQEFLLDVLKQVLSEVQERMSSTHGDFSGIQVTLNVPDGLSYCVARRGIGFAFFNVLKNAYESFMTGPSSFEKHGEIVVTATDCGESVKLTFQDTGHGLSEDDLERVRTFTFRGTSKKSTGSGFGLPIVCRRIEDHNGTIHIDSKLGVGTTVTIILPNKGGSND